MTALPSGTLCDEGWLVTTVTTVAVVASACAQEETADPHIRGRSRRDGKLGEKVDPRGFIASNDSLEDSVVPWNQS